MGSVRFLIWEPSNSLLQRSSLLFAALSDCWISVLYSADFFEDFAYRSLNRRIIAFFRDNCEDLLELAVLSTVIGASIRWRSWWCDMRVTEGSASSMLLIFDLCEGLFDFAFDPWDSSGVALTVLWFGSVYSDFVYLFWRRFLLESRRLIFRIGRFRWWLKGLASRIL